MTAIWNRKRTVLTLVVALSALAPAAWAGGIDDFKLTRAIPADAFLAWHTRDHAGKEFVNKQMERIWEAIEAQHFERDIKKFFKALQQQPTTAPGEETTAFDAQWQKFQDLCAGVDWSHLAQREFAMGVKLTFPMNEFVLLLLPPEGKTRENFEGLTRMLQTVAELDPNMIKLTTEETGDTVIHKVSLAAELPFPLGLTLAAHKDVILVGFGATMPEQSLALLRGEGGQSLAATPRFQEAFKRLPPPADELLFFDVGKCLAQVREVINAALKMAEPSAPAEGEPGYDDFVKWKALPGKILDALDIFEYLASVATTAGLKTTADSVLVLRDDAQTRPLYKVLFGNEPLADPLKYVPQNAGDFWATSGVNLPALYEALVKIIREDVPDGQMLLAQIEALKNPQTGPGIDIEQDIVGWIGGRLITFSVPGPTPYAFSKWMLMLSVRDEAKAREMLGRLVGVAEPLLVQWQGSIVDAEIADAEGFKSLVLPALTMMGLDKPTFGVKDGWLFVGSSPDIIVASTEVAAGKLENFSSNERFQKEGLPGAGSVTSLSFTDMTGFGEQLGQALQMISAFAQLSGGGKDPMTRNLLLILTKVGRVVKEINFLQSSAARSTFDGKVLVSRSITTYREPPAITKPKPPARPGESETGQPESGSEEEEGEG